MKRDTNEAPKPLWSFSFFFCMSGGDQSEVKRAAKQLCASIGVRMRVKVESGSFLYVCVWPHIWPKTRVDICILKLKCAAREKEKFL